MPEFFVRAKRLRRLHVVRNRLSDFGGDGTDVLEASMKVLMDAIDAIDSDYARVAAVYFGINVDAAKMNLTDRNNAMGVRSIGPHMSGLMIATEWT